MTMGDEVVSLAGTTKNWSPSITAKFGRPVARLAVPTGRPPNTWFDM
jgi:hypothetical protein